MDKNKSLIKDNIILILEDDAIIPDKFWINYQKYMAELPKNWDMVLFGGCRLKGHSYTKHLIKPKKLSMEIGVPLHT